MSENTNTNSDFEAVRHLASIIDSSDDAIISKNLNGIIQSWNKSAERLFGYTAEEAIGKSILMLIPPDLAHEEPSIIQRIRQGERIEHFETERLRKDGSRVAISLTVSPVRDAAGNVKGASKIARDISDLQRAEMLQRRFSAIVESSDDAILSKDLNGVIQSWNRGAERIFGYTAEEAIGKSVQMLLPAGREDEEPEILRKIRGGDRVDHYETVRRRKDGSLVEISLSVSPIRDGKGKVVGATKIARDISERKRADVIQRRLSAIVESSEDAIVSKDLNGVIQSWNAGAQRMFGWTAAEAIGQPITILIPEGREGEEPRILERIRRGERIEHLETVRKRKDGTRLSVSIAVSPVKDSFGNVLGAAKIVRDITERKEAQAALEKLTGELDFANGMLEKKVLERTASLNAALAQMREFSYTVSHDLRGPVRAMQGYATAVLEDYGGRLDDHARSHLGRIIASGARMEKLIYDVLAYSRISAANLELQPLDTGQAIRDIIEHSDRFQAPRATIMLQEPLLPVLGNETAFTQAVTNLLDNAVKFMAPKTAPLVEIWTEQRNGTVRLWVKDNGVGIKPGRQARIFEVFERGHQDSSFEGTGIGLAIARRAAEKMEGAIGLESSGEGGSAFWIDLKSFKY